MIVFMKSGLWFALSSMSWAISMQSCFCCSDIVHMHKYSIKRECTDSLLLDWSLILACGWPTWDATMFEAVIPLPGLTFAHSIITKDLLNLLDGLKFHQAFSKSWCNISAQCIQLPCIKTGKFCEKSKICTCAGRVISLPTHLIYYTRWQLKEFRNEDSSWKYILVNFIFVSVFTWIMIIDPYYDQLIVLRLFQFIRYNI